MINAIQTKLLNLQLDFLNKTNIYKLNLNELNSICRVLSIYDSKNKNDINLLINHIDNYKMMIIFFLDY